MTPLRRLLLGLMLAMSVLALFPAPQAHALSENYVARPFRAFYRAHDGMRLLGPSQTGLRTIDGYPAQYFDKGRLEDHRAEVSDPAWALMYGRLTVELMERAPQTPANATDLTYGHLLAAGADMAPVPAGFAQGTLAVDDGTFVPLHPQLEAAPGYVVPDVFWRYITRADLFPGGWLHDIGLPLTNALTASTVKNGEQRSITMQAFERTVLTYDPLNPESWQVERGNIGADAMRVDPTLAPRGVGTKRIEVDLSEQWLTASAGTEVVYDAPVSTGKDGFETPTGTFKVYLKHEKQTMRGSMGGESWVVPDVPHVMYFTGSVALHGAYWHKLFGSGRRLSHGCVNLPLDAAELLYKWAPLGTQVTVRR